MKPRGLIVIAVGVGLFLSTPPSFAGLLDNVVGGGLKGLAGSKSGGGGGGDVGKDIQRCKEQTDEFANNIEYTSYNNGPEKISAKLGKPDKIISNDRDYWKGQWSLKDAKSVTVEIGCVPDKCEVSCLTYAKPKRGDALQACKATVSPFNENVECNVDNCPKKLEEVIGNKAKFSYKEADSAGGDIAYPEKFKEGEFQGSAIMRDVHVHFSCDKKKCSVGCSI